MAGLSMKMGAFGGGSGYTGGGLMPSAANAPSSTIAQRAYGIQAGVTGQSRVPAYGSVGLGLLGAAVLVWLWYSLPR